MKILFSIFLCLLVNLGFAQSQKRDFKIIEMENHETQVMFEAINKANGLINKNPSDALSEVEKALKISYRYKNIKGEAHSYQTLGAIHYRLSSYKESVNYYDKALELFKKLNDTKSQYIVYKHLGPALESNGDLKRAATNNRTFLQLALARNNANDELLAKESLGRVLFNSGSFKEANTLYQQLLTYYRSAQNTDMSTTTYEHIGKCYAGLKDTAQALKYFNLAGVLSEGSGSEDEQLSQWQNVSRSYKSVGKLDKSVEYEKKALDLNRKRGNKSDMISNNANIANDYLFMNKANEAIPFLEDNINLAEEIGEVKSSGQAYKTLSDAYVQLGKIDDAKSSFEKYRELQVEELVKRETELDEREANTSGLFDKEKQIELLVRDKELDEEKIQLLEQEKTLRAEAMRGQRQLNYVLAGVLTLLVIGLLLLYRSVKQKKIANKLLSIRSLRSQMNPHFIFNSLNSVNSFISKSDERSANKYLTEFARLMRTVLEHSRQDFVTLADELSVLERYLNLEHIRFSEHFDFELTVDEDLETTKLLIPPMLIQPYIENAIWHGLRYGDKKGYLKVIFTAFEGRMEIEIVDNGIGRTRSEQLKTKNQKAGTSTGISNTKSRLKLLNEVHHLKLHANLSDLNDDGSGTRVLLELPFIDVDDKRYAEV